MDFEHIQHRSECFFLPMVLHQSECIIQRSGGFAGSATLEFAALEKEPMPLNTVPKFKTTQSFLGHLINQVSS